MANINETTRATDGTNYDLFNTAIDSGKSVEITYEAPSDFDHIKRIEMLVNAGKVSLSDISVEMKVGVKSFIHAGTPGVKFEYNSAAPDGLRGFVFVIPNIRNWVIPTKGKNISFILKNNSTTENADINVIVEYAKE